MQLVIDMDGVRHNAAFGPEHPKVVVGRLKKCDLVIKSPKVSRVHCEFRWTERGMELKDCDSSAGTFVNGRKVGRARITADDDIRVADVQIQILEALPPTREADVNDPQEMRTSKNVEDAPALDVWELVYRDENDVEKICRMENHGAQVIIGRRSDTDIRVVNPTVGRHHCKVVYDGGDLKVQDLDSSNGTFVNGERIKTCTLADGDVLECGTAPIHIRLIAAEGAETGETWHDEVFEDEMGPPNWFLLYKDDDGKVAVTEMALELRVLAVGSDRACEIRVESRGVEAEHIELVWEYGVLVVRDLGTAAGTVLNGREVDEVVLRNGDVITLCEFQIHLIRGSAGEVLRARTGQRSTEADYWAPILSRRDDGLSFTYIDTDPTEPSRKRELTLWPDGEATLDIVQGEERTTTAGRVSTGIIDVLMDGLVRAGFPDVPTEHLDDDEFPADLEVYLDSELSTVTFSRRIFERSAVYKEIAQLLSTVVTIIND